MTDVRPDHLILANGLDFAEERVQLTSGLVRFLGGRTGRTAHEQAEDLRQVATMLIEPDAYWRTRKIKNPELRATALGVTEPVLRAYERMHPTPTKPKKGKK